MEQTGTSTGHWINMLVPKNSIKSCQKYMKVVEYWHGAIKKYRYDRDVSRDIQRYQIMHIRIQRRTK